MTRKDYDLITACLGASYKRYEDNDVAIKAINDVKRRLTLEFQLENPRFNLSKFNLRMDYWIDISRVDSWFDVSSRY